MPSSSTHGDKRHSPFMPLLISVLLLGLLAAALYRLYTLNQQDEMQNSILLEKARTHGNTLKEEIANLEGWLEKTPCEVKVLLHETHLLPVSVLHEPLPSERQRSSWLGETAVTGGRA